MFNCVRCGRLREDHDTNMVMNSDKELERLGAETIEDGYELSLLSCCDIPRPADYTVLMQREGYFFGYGAGYVSPNPAEEDRLWRESWPMFSGHSILLLLSGGQMVDIGL